MALGGNVTCTINNNDNAPALHLRKTVTNDNGGRRRATDWTLTATGTGATPTNLSGTHAGRQRRHASRPTPTPSPRRRPGRLHRRRLELRRRHRMPDATHVTVPLGGNVTCTITNNDNAPALHLRKTVTNDNGGDGRCHRLDADRDRHRRIADQPVGHARRSTAAAPSRPTPTRSVESGPAGYTAGAWNCGCGHRCPAATHVTVALGGNVTCTITNNDNAPALHLRKTVTNDNGGTAAATDWTLTATGTGASPTNLSGSTPVDSGATFKADTYTLAESGPAGYTRRRLELRRGHRCPTRPMSRWRSAATSPAPSTTTTPKAQPAGTTVQNWVFTTRYDHRDPLWGWRCGTLASHSASTPTTHRHAGRV